MAIPSFLSSFHAIHPSNLSFFSPSSSSSLTVYFFFFFSFFFSNQSFFSFSLFFLLAAALFIIEFRSVSSVRSVIWSGCAVCLLTKFSSVRFICVCFIFLPAAALFIIEFRSVSSVRSVIWSVCAVCLLTKFSSVHLCVYFSCWANSIHVLLSIYILCDANRKMVSLVESNCRWKFFNKFMSGSLLCSHSAGVASDETSAVS